ncbi:MAG: DUF2341 domain-containing protein [Sedimentisphaerales bacterium]
MYIRKSNISVITFLITYFIFNLQIVNVLGTENPPSPSEVANTVNNKWLSRDFNDLDTYITNLYSSFPDFIPAILASSFQDYVYKGHLSDAMQKFNQVKQWVEQNPGVVSEDFITQMYLIEWFIQSDIDMYTRLGISESELEPDPNAVRDVCGGDPFPLIKVLEYCDFALIWYDSDWDYRKKITIQNDFVDSNLADFPLYVKVDSDPNIGAHAQANGNDIVFTLADGVTQIPYEKEAFSITSGNATGHFWVKVPTINSSTTTDIYLYYGDPNASDGQNVSGVWDNGQVGVWHLSETSGDAKDSTSNGYDLSLSGPEQNQAGKIGKAYDFVSTNSDHGQIEAQFITAYPITLMAWVNPDSITQGDYYLPVWLGDEDLTNSYWAIILNYSGNGKVGAYHNNLIPSIAYSSNTLTAGNWHQVVAVFNTSSDRRCYVDGGDKGTSTYYSGSSNYPDRFSIGYAGDSTPGYYLDGLLDEVRVYNRALSDAEVKFSYYNQNESDNELTWQSEETL